MEQIREEGGGPVRSQLLSWGHPLGGGGQLAELWVCVKEEPIRDP